MCGIAGIIHLNKQPADSFQIRRMTAAMEHRGPDADGHFVEGPVALGHRRLSIIDLSPAGNQPFTSHCGKYKMVFNGELYNFQEVREQIKDHEFISTGDTEVLMEGWVRWGLGAVEKLKGMFSFAIWDSGAQELFLFRDRLGVKPLYYYQDEDRFIFASEIRAILAAGGVRKKISPHALASYLTYQSVNGEQSILEGIYELKAGHFIRIRGREVETKQYWNMISADPLYQGEPLEQVKKNIREMLHKAVAERLISDVPVGAFLSGGIDSSTVVGLMASASKSSPNTFNICFDEADFDESRYAEMIAKKFNTNHHRILLKSSSILDNLIPALGAMDTPSGDGINSYTVSKAIRGEGITVALSGIGGDELFAGYPFFRQYSSIRRFQGIWKMSGPFRNLAAAFIGGNSRKERIKQLLQARHCSIEEFYPVFRQVLPPAYVSELTDLPISPLSAINVVNGLRSSLDTLPEYSQVSVAEYLGYTQHTLLKDTDQMSMAVSLEVREPFFDHELVQYVLQLPDHIKEPVYPKKLLVESLNGLLPDEIVHRKKQGFVFPWPHWMRTELRQFCTEKIESISARPFIREKALLNEWQKFLKGDPAIQWMQIWLFVILEHWLEKNDIQ